MSDHLCFTDDTTCRECSTKPRWTTRRGPRVHEAARLMGLTSKDVMRMCRDHDFWVLSPSTTLTVREYLMISDHRYCASTGYVHR